MRHYSASRYGVGDSEMTKQDRIRILFEEHARRKRLTEQEDCQVKHEVAEAQQLTLEEIMK